MGEHEGVLMAFLTWLWVIVMMIAEGTCVALLLMLFALFLGLKGPWYRQNQGEVLR